MDQSRDPTEVPELKDLVVTALENSGALARIRAQLRACVYLTIENRMMSNTPENQLKTFLAKEEPHLAMLLVQDLLRKLNMQYSLSVFQAEQGATETIQRITTEEAAIELDLDSTNEEPLLIQLIKKETTRRNSSLDQRPKTAPRPKRSAASFAEELSQDTEMPASH